MSSKNDFTVAGVRGEDQKRAVEDQALMRKASLIRDRDIREDVYTAIDERRADLKAQEAENEQRLQQAYYEALDEKKKPALNLTMDHIAPVSEEEIRRQTMASVRAQFGTQLEAELKQIEKTQLDHITQTIDGHLEAQRDRDAENSQTFRDEFSRARTDAARRSFQPASDPEHER